MSSVTRRHNPVSLPAEHPVEKTPDDDPGPWTLGTVITGVLLFLFLGAVAAYGIPALLVLTGR